HLRSSRAGDSVGGETRAIGKGVPGTHSGAGGPPTRGREGPSRRRPVARDLRGDRFQFPGIWPRISKIYFFFFFWVPGWGTSLPRFFVLGPIRPFRSPPGFAFSALSPFCFFRVLRPFRLV